MKSIPRVVLCTTGVLSVICLLFISTPLEREEVVIGWTYNTTRNTSQYILVNNSSANFMPEHVCDQHTFLLMIVCSAPTNFDARNAIRKTWGEKQTIRGQEVLTYFLIGETLNSSLQKDLRLESQYYSDVIQEHFIDSYNNLTLKSIQLLKIASTYCVNTTDYLLKIDDDMFVNVPRLIDWLLNKNVSSGLLTGKLICGAKPITNPTSKWYSPQYMYDEQIYPNYLSGTGYLMTLDVAKKLFETTLNTPIFHLEDIYITGITARKAGIKPKNNVYFTYNTLHNDTCEYSNLITMHRFNSTMILSTYEKLRNNSSIKHCKPSLNAQKWLISNVFRPSRMYRKKCQ